MAADSSFEGLSLDPSKGGKLMSMEKKRELVYEISNWPEGASEILQSWSRQEILQILCFEMGKERKYTGLTKLKIIEHLLKIVSEKKSSSSLVKKSNEDAIDSESSQRTAKRQRKTEQPSRLAFSTSNASGNATKIIDLTTDAAAVYCKNSACKATLSPGDAFCKRCSCCDCFKYDDNKDPSLWLICGSEPPFQGVSCGMSCHLECALKREATGIGLVGKPGALDGSFQCLSCRKVNDLLGCWRKQFLIAKETRRVDILCYRVSLSQKLLRGTVKYEKLYEIVDEAVKKLESEVGPLTGLPAKMGRGIVNRLSSGPEVQKLCGSALDLLDSMFSSPTFHPQPGSSSMQVSDKKTIIPDTIKFEEVRPTSITVILDSENAVSHGNLTYKLWHRKAHDTNYPRDPTCENLRPNTGFNIVGLDPGTEYCFNVVSFDGANELIKKIEARSSTVTSEDILSPTTNCSSLSNPSSVEDETNNDGGDRAAGSDDAAPIEAVDEKGKLAAEEPGTECVPFVTVAGDLPITPCKLERSKPAGKDLLESGPGDGKRDLEYYVKIIRWLECEGHIEKNFRQKFLTWYSLRATRQEVQIVKVFVETLIEEPASLAAQLVDTFSDSLSSNRSASSSSNVPNGFCMKLWH